MALKKATNKAIIKALTKYKGLIQSAADALRISRDTIELRIKTVPEVRAALVRAREKLGDIAESKLLGAIRKGEAWAICFYLKTKFKKRGYIERKEIRSRGSLNVSLSSGARRDRLIALASVMRNRLGANGDGAVVASRGSNGHTSGLGGNGKHGTLDAGQASPGDRPSTNGHSNGSNGSASHN